MFPTTSVQWGLRRPETHGVKHISWGARRQGTYSPLNLKKAFHFLCPAGFKLLAPDTRAREVQVNRVLWCPTAVRQQQHAQAGETLFTKQVLPVVSSDESEAGVLAASRRNHLASTETSRSKRDLMTAPAAITPILPRSRGPERAYRATTGAQHMCHNPSRAVLTQDRAGFTGSAKRERCPECRLHGGRAGRLNNNNRIQLVRLCAVAQMSAISLSVAGPCAPKAA